MIRVGYPTQNLRYLALENDERVLAKQAGAHAYSEQSRDWHALLGGRETDVMVEAKGKEYAPMDVDIG